MSMNVKNKHQCWTRFVRVKRMSIIRRTSFCMAGRIHFSTSSLTSYRGVYKFVGLPVVMNNNAHNLCQPKCGPWYLEGHSPQCCWSLQKQNRKAFLWFFPLGLPMSPGNAPITKYHEKRKPIHPSPPHCLTKSHRRNNRRVGPGPNADTPNAWRQACRALGKAGGLWVYGALINHSDGYMEAVGESGILHTQTNIDYRAMSRAMEGLRFTQYTARRVWCNLDTCSLCNDLLIIQYNTDMINNFPWKGGCTGKGLLEYCLLPAEVSFAPAKRRNV